MAEEARKRLLNRSLSNRQLLGSSVRSISTTSLTNQQRPKSSLTRPVRASISCTTAHAKTGVSNQSAGCETEKGTTPQVTVISKSISCIEISGVASKSTTSAPEGRSTDDLTTPNQGEEQPSTSITSYMPTSSSSSMSLTVLDECLSGTVEGNNTSTSSSSSHQETDSSSTNSDTTDSTLNISSASTGELVKEEKDPDLTADLDSGVQLDVDMTHVNDDPESTSDDKDRSNCQLHRVYHNNPSSNAPSSDASIVPISVSSLPPADIELDKKVSKTTQPKKRRRRRSSLGSRGHTNTSQSGSKTSIKKTASTSTKLKQKNKH